MPSRLYKDLKLWYKANRNSAGVTHSQIPSNGDGDAVFTGGVNSDNLATLDGTACPSLELVEPRDDWRIKDLVSNEIIVDKEFTFYIDFDAVSEDSNTIISLRAERPALAVPGSKIITIGLLNDPDRYRVRSEIGNTAWIPNTPGDVDTIDGFVRIIVKYDGSNLSFFLNGVKEGFNSQTFTEVVDEIELNPSFGSAEVPGTVRINEIAMWNFPKTDAECLELTRV